MKRYNVPGHAHFLTFSTYQRLPILTADSVLRTLAKHVRLACDELDTALWAYVFMPEHVHLLVRPRREDYSISDFLRKVKEPFAREALRALREMDPSLWRRLLVILPSGRQFGRFWQPGGGYDVNLRTKQKAREKACYCHRNPVIRGLVEAQEDWWWSSYRSLEMGQQADAALRIDAWKELGPTTGW